MDVPNQADIREFEPKEVGRFMACSTARTFFAYPVTPRPWVAENVKLWA
jgi:hypothetical protein